MTDNYAVGLIDYDNRDVLKNVVSNTDAKLLDQMKEYDNSWLVKYIFKH